MPHLVDQGAVQEQAVPLAPARLAGHGGHVPAAIVQLLRQARLPCIAVGLGAVCGVEVGGRVSRLGGYRGWAGGSDSTGGCEIVGPS